MGGHQGGRGGQLAGDWSIEDCAEHVEVVLSLKVGMQTVADQFSSGPAGGCHGRRGSGPGRPELRGMGTLDDGLQPGYETVCRSRRRQPRRLASRWRSCATHAGSHARRRDGDTIGEVAAEKAAGYRFRHVITNVIGGPEAGVYVRRTVDLQLVDRMSPLHGRLDGDGVGRSDQTVRDRGI